MANVAAGGPSERARREPNASGAPRGTATSRRRVLRQVRRPACQSTHATCPSEPGAPRAGSTALSDRRRRFMASGVAVPTRPVRGTPVRRWSARRWPFALPRSHQRTARDSPPGREPGCHGVHHRVTASEARKFRSPQRVLRSVRMRPVATGTPRRAHATRLQRPRFSLEEPSLVVMNESQCRSSARASIKCCQGATQTMSRPKSPAHTTPIRPSRTRGFVGEAALARPVGFFGRLTQWLGTRRAAGERARSAGVVGPRPHHERATIERTPSLRGPTR